jgi:2-dehydropantoate 2-reductase
MNVLIFGTGGVGCIYAYILVKSGAQVTAVCRSNYDVVSTKGITLDSALFGTVTANPTAVRHVSDAQGPFDYILVCAKNFPDQAKLIAPAVSPKTSIILCQNGIDIEPEYVLAYPSNTVISGVVYLPTTQVSPGFVKMGPLQLLHVGTYPATAGPAAKEATQRFADLFSKGGGIIRVHDDIQAQRWVKLAVNIAWNPICALSQCDDANFMRSSEAAEPAIRAVMAEVAWLAGTAGYPDVVTPAAIDEQLERPRQRLKTGGKEPSMLTDVREGRALEAEAILGNAVRIARRLNVSTPYLDLLYALAKGLSFAIEKPNGEWKPIA